MQELQYTLFTLNINNEWHPYEFLLDQEMSEDKVLEYILKMLLKKLHKKILCGLIFYYKDPHWIPIVFAYYRSKNGKESIIIEEIEAAGYLGLSNSILSEILRQQISRKVPFVHNINFLGPKFFTTYEKNDDDQREPSDR